MPIVKIDGIEYDVDQLGIDVKSQIVCIQFVDAEMARLQVQGAVLQTARAAYSKALKELLSNTGRN